MQAREGNADSFCELVRRHERHAIGVAFAITGNASTAGDVVQEAFLQVWRKLSDLQNADRFGPWFFQIVRHRALDRTRRKSASQLDETIELPANCESPDNAIETHELQQRLSGALSKLDEISRHAVVMRHFENLSSKEIAARLSLSVSAVDMRLSRAREALRESLAGFAVS